MQPGPGSPELPYRFALRSLLALGAGISYSEQPRSRPVDDSIEQWMRTQHVPGLSVAVVKNGTLTALETPPFAITVDAPPRVSNSEAEITIQAKDEGKAAAASVLEMEIWDAEGKAVYKQNKSDEDFASGETKSYRFHWTPAEAGNYTVNVGVYGPKWKPCYSWSENAARITVEQVISK